MPQNSLTFTVRRKTRWFEAGSVGSKCRERQLVLDGPAQSRARELEVSQTSYWRAASTGYWMLWDRYVAAGRSPRTFRGRGYRGVMQC